MKIHGRNRRRDRTREREKNTERIFRCQQSCLIDLFECILWKSCFLNLKSFVPCNSDFEIYLYIKCLHQSNKSIVFLLTDFPHTSIFIMVMARFKFNQRSTFFLSQFNSCEIFVMRFHGVSLWAFTIQKCNLFHNIFQLIKFAIKSIFFSN